MNRLVVLLVAAIAVGCGKDAEHPPQFELVPPASGRREPPVLALRTDCVNLGPAKVALSGVLRVEEHRGPPGYGETPKLDTHDTVVVLVVDRSVAACGDSSLGPDASATVNATRFQLGRISGDLVREGGKRVTVFGELRHRVWGFQRTKIVIDVDSIPALHSRRVSAT